MSSSDIQHCFEIRTANVDYFVGQDAAKANNNNLATGSSSGMGTDLAKEWENAVRKALMPVMQGGAVPQPTHHPSHR